MEPQTTLSIKDLIDLLFAARERIDFYWNFYAVVVIAVVGWLVSVKRTLTSPMKALVTVAYLVAAGMNLVGIYGAYGFAEAVRRDLLRASAAAPLADTRLLLAQHSYLSQRWTALVIHLIVGATFLAVLWRSPFSEREMAAEQGERSA